MMPEAHVICLSFPSADAAADALAAIGPALAGSGVARPIALVPREDLLILRRLTRRGTEGDTPAGVGPAVAGPAKVPPAPVALSAPASDPVAPVSVATPPPPARRGRLREEDIPTPTVFRPGVAAADPQDILDAYHAGPEAMQRLAADRGWSPAQIRVQAEKVMRLIQEDLT